MIKLISKRTKEPKEDSVIYRKKCPHCGAVFEYNYSDTDGWIDDLSSTIKCPDCGMTSSHHFWYKKKKNK